MGKAMASVSCPRQNLVSARWLSLLCGPPQNRYFNITVGVTVISLVFYLQKGVLHTGAVQRGCGSCVPDLGAWRGSHVPGLG